MALGGIPTFNPNLSAGVGKPREGGGNPITGFFDNLWDDISNTITGFPQGMKVIGSAIGNDVGNILTGDFDSGDFKTDDILDAVWEDYKHVYGPAFGSGDVGTTLKRINENPLGPILDVASIITLGGASAGALGARAAMAGARGGTLSTKAIDQLANIGGLRRLTGSEGVTNFTHTRRIGDKDVDVLRPEILAAEQNGGRFIVGADGKGHLFAPKTEDLISGSRRIADGEFARESVTLSRNPMKRHRQQFGIFIANTFPEWKLIGANPRVARIERRTQRGAQKRAEVATLGPLTRMFESRTNRKAMKDPRLSTAAELIVNRVTPEERFKQLTTDEAILVDDAKDIGRLDDAINQVNEVVRQVEAGTLNKTDAAAVAERFKEVVGTFGRNQGTDEFGFDSILSRLNERKRAAQDIDLIQPQMKATKERMRDLITNKLTDEEAGRVAEMAQAYERVGVATTDMLRDAGVKVGDDRHLMPQRIIGRDGDALDTDAVTTSTTLDRSLQMEMRDKAKVLTQGTRPANSKFASGYTYRYGLSFLEPEQVIRSYRTAARFKLQRERFSLNVNRMKVVQAGTQIPKGWVPVDTGNTRFQRMLKNMQQVVNEEMPIIFGEGSAALKEMQDTFGGALKSKIDTVAEGSDAARANLRLIAPESAVKELFNETRRSTETWKRALQEMSSIWRFSVLNLRPQWLLNSIFGSNLLLGASVGPYKMIRGTLMANPLRGLSSRGRDFARIVDETAGNIRLQGAGRIETEASLQFMDHSLVARKLGLLNEPNGKMGSVMKNGAMGPLRGLRWWGEFMGRLNARVADDYPRRARFYELIRPQVKRMQKRNPEMTFNEAAELLLTKVDDATGDVIPNEKLIDNLSKQVLDDLVDFDDLTDFERNTLRYAVPFWSWMKGSTKFASRFPVDNPIGANLGRIMAEAGSEDLAKELGFEPESFLRNVLTLGETEPGKERVISTAGINPFVTPLDLGEALRGLTKRGELKATTNPLNIVNPFIKSLAEAAFNRSTFTGGPITGPIAGRTPDDTSFFPRLGEQLVRSFPQTRLLTETVGRDSARDRSKLFTPGFAPEVARLVGSPIRELNIQQARAKARQFASEN
jgi:hypothetical protein